MKTDTDDRGQWTSASSAGPDRLCPGRHLKQKGLPDPAPTEDSLRGIKIHAALRDSNPSVLDPADVEIYDRLLEHEKQRKHECFGEATPKVSTTREKRFWAQFGDLRHSGKPDLVLRHGSLAVVMEYKTGRGDVPESPRNEQLRDQAALVFLNTPLLKTILVDIDQPFAPKQGPCIYSELDLKRALSDMRDRVIASNDPNSKRIAGEEQCQFCKAKSVCAEYNAWAAASLPIVPTADASPTLMDLPVASWTPDQCVLFCERVGVAEKWIELCKAEIKARLKKQPDSIPGLALKPGAVIKKITDPQGVFTRFEALGGKLEQYMQCLTVTKEKLETQLRALTGAKGKALDEAMEAITKDLVSETQNAPSIVRTKK